jgi:hypothetical protein
MNDVHELRFGLRWIRSLWPEDDIALLHDPFEFRNLKSDYSILSCDPRCALKDCRAIIHQQTFGMVAIYIAVFCASSSPFGPIYVCYN